MSYDKFIQNRTIAKQQIVDASLDSAKFPSYILSSFIDFETDGYLVGIQYMCAHASISGTAGSIDTYYPAGSIVAKVSADGLTITEGGNVTNFSGAQILLSHLSLPSNDGTSGLEADSRQTTIAYDADSKRIPIKSNDKLGVYLCANGLDSQINFCYTLTAYFVRS